VIDQIRRTTNTIQMHNNIRHQITLDGPNDSIEAMFGGYTKGAPLPAIQTIIENFWAGWNYETGEDNTCWFTTSYDGIQNLVETLSIFYPDVTIYYWHASEKVGVNCASYVFKNGMSCPDLFPDYDLYAVELSFELWPD